jgi:chemotaxis protein MotB
MNPHSPRASWIDIALQRKAEDERQRRARSKNIRRNRYERWHVPETLDREPDNWLMTYLDLITLLLALFVVMLALTRLGPGLAAEPPEIATGLSLSKLPPAPVRPWAVNLPDIPAEWATVPIPKPPAPETTAPAEPLKQPPPPVKMPTAEQLGLKDLGKSVKVEINRQSVNFRISSELLFTSGQATLSKEGVSVVKQLAEVINRSKFPISVEGHSDNVPILTRQFASNWELSASRATSVLRELVNDGVDPQRLRAVGYADTKPLESNDTPEGRAANRRVELIMRIVPQAAPDRPAPASEHADQANTAKAQ